MDVFLFFENDNDNWKMTNPRFVQEQTKTDDEQHRNCEILEKKILKENLRKFRLASWVVRICTDFAPPTQML